MTGSSDTIDDLVGIAPGSRLDALRAQRPQARANAQTSYEALFAPATPVGTTLAERFAVAAFVAGLHEQPRVRAFYAAHLARHGGAALDSAVAAAIGAGRTRGPYGAYPPGLLSREDQAGPRFLVDPATRGATGARLAAALEHAHLLVFHPRDASPEALQALLDAGWTTTEIVTLSQLVAFLSFQIRVIAGLQVLGADAGNKMSETIATHPDLDRPDRFTQDEIGWVPWLQPLDAADLTERHWAALVDAARAKSPYFMVLVRDPAILEARTKTDKDIFYNPNAGLPRAERELSALAASRHNGCIFCASVHARFAAHHSKRRDEVQRLLDEGVGATIDARWDAIVAASVALSQTPLRFGPEHIERLREAGLDDLAIADVVHGAAFFNWANRLMLSLGEPEGVPRQTS